MQFKGLLACACIWLWAAAGQTPAQPVDPIVRLVSDLEAAANAGDPAAVRALARPSIVQAQLSEFVQTLTFPKVSRATIKERDRSVAGTRLRLILEIFTEREIEGRVSTWRVDVEPVDGTDGRWGMASIERLTVVSGLYRLALDTSVEYTVRNLTITQPDLTLTMPSGYAFVARTPEGPTAVVFVGRGRLEFAPKPAAERGQVRIFSGDDALKTAFDAVFLRINPAQYAAQIDAASLAPRPSVDGRHARRATEMLETHLPKSFRIDLNDLSADEWSLAPTGNDFVAEIKTGRYGVLTYARANGEPEDISFFDRRRHRNISVYASSEKLDSRGRFFSEDDQLDYDVTHYEIEASFAPERMWVDGTATITMHTRQAYLSTLSLRLAEPLVVRSVTSPQFGRLLHLRVVGQNTVLIGFPGTIVSESDVDVVVTYGGRLPPQSVDREALAIEQDQVRDDQIVVPLEPVYIYSNRSYWYPQAQVTDFATAKLTVTVPGEMDAIATGTSEGPAVDLPSAPGERARRRFIFDSEDPARYLSVLISRFQPAQASSLTLEDDHAVALTVTANPRQTSKIRSMSEKTADIFRFYSALLDDAPYDSFTLALTESDLPGGHSPAYFAMLNQPLPTSPYVWVNDPVSFPGYPSFFVAHEIAHQWWGQAIGWKNYHEQWISEGFAQYFAALYAAHERGDDQFASVLRQMRKWAIDLSDQGPVYLGYRLGHIKSDGRVFRALVYNKGAMVLHMLRRLIGDEPFFRGLRAFYAEWRFKKAGTGDFRAAMEQASGRSLERFFDRWIFGSGIPQLRFTSRVDAAGLHVRFEQKGEVFDVPVTVTIAYEDGTSEDVVVALADAVTERVLPVKGAVRDVDINRDNSALAEFDK